MGDENTPDLKRLEESISPAAERASRLEPYRDVILRWRAVGHSFRRIHAALAQNGIQVGLMTLHEFVKRRQTVALQSTGGESPVTTEATAPAKRTAEEIAARRDQARAANHRGSEDGQPAAPAKFEYDPEDRPLTNRPRGEQ